MDHVFPYLKPKSSFSGCFALGSFIKSLKNVLNAGHISTARCKQFSFCMIYDRNMAMDKHQTK